LAPAPGIITNVVAVIVCVDVRGGRG